MILNAVFVEILSIITSVLDFLIPFDPISRFALVSASVLNYLPTIVRVMGDVFFFIPKSYLDPLISFTLAIMILRLGISVWRFLPWGKLFG